MLATCSSRAYLPALWSLLRASQSISHSHTIMLLTCELTHTLDADRLPVVG